MENLLLGIWRGGRLTVLASLFVFGVGCTTEQPVDKSKPLVAVSVLPQAFFVRKVAGQLVDLQVMIPPGANPATHEPTMAQLKALSRAQVYVKVGHPNFPFERVWLDKLIAENKDLRLVDMSAGVTMQDEDPHLWLSPQRVSIIVKNIAFALNEVFPTKKNFLRNNLLLFLAEINKLDRHIQKTFEESGLKVFLVYHPAWGYFAEQYGLRQLSIEHQHKEPSPHELEKVIEAAVAEGIAVVFVQPHFSRESAELVAKEIRGTVIEIDPLAYNWLENMKRVALALTKSQRYGHPSTGN